MKSNLFCLLFILSCSLKINGQSNNAKLECWKGKTVGFDYLIYKNKLLSLSKYDTLEFTLLRAKDSLWLGNYFYKAIGSDIMGLVQYGIGVDAMAVLSASHNELSLMSLNNANNILVFKRVRCSCKQRRLFKIE